MTKRRFSAGSRARPQARPEGRVEDESREPAKSGDFVARKPPNSRLVDDPLWGSRALAYHVSMVADAPCRAAMQGALDALDGLSGTRGCLHILPASTLHSTAYTVAPVRESFDKEAYMQQVRLHVSAILAQHCNTCAPFELRFRTVRATSSAVIAVADEEATDAVWRLRRRLADELLPPPCGPARYDLVHMTLARYSNAARLPSDFVARVDALGCDSTLKVTELCLVRETVYPSLRTEIVERYPLSLAS